MDLANKKPLIAGVAVVGIAIAAWLAFGFFGIQTAFIDNEVNESADHLFTAAPAAVEEAPEADVSETAEAADQPVEASTEEAPVEEPAAEEEPATPVEEAPVEEEPAAPVEEEPVVEDAPAEEPPAEEATTPGEIVTIASGAFASTNGYSVTGDALVLNNGTEQRFLRFENFVSDNGPDLKVYLRAANGEFVSLGDLSGNIGDQNYEIPVDVDLSVFTNVEIWCERFSAGFGVATLA